MENVTKGGGSRCKLAVFRLWCTSILTSCPRSVPSVAPASFGQQETLSAIGDRRARSQPVEGGDGARACDTVLPADSIAMPIERVDSG